MTISGASATYSGAGTINGEGAFNFEVTVVDAEFDDQDLFLEDRIWVVVSEEGTDEVIYDNGATDPPGDEGAELGGGSIVFHSNSSP
jgi:hypothetical protein